MSDAYEPDDRHVRPFNEFLAQQGKGATHAELSEALNGLVSAVIEHQKVGKLTLDLTVKPAGTVGSHAVFITDEIKVRAPKGSRPVSLFFVDSDGNVTRNDPNQLELPAVRLVGDNDAAPKGEEAAR